jgi:signal transduction histidine kinase
MRLRTLPVLGAVFGTLLALIVFTSASVFVKSAEFQDKFAAAERSYHRAANILIAVRSDIYASMFTVQQYLLDPTGGSRSRALDELSKIRKSSNAHLNNLKQRFGPGANENLERLNDELERHWRSLDEGLNSVNSREPPSRRLSEGFAALDEALRATRKMDEVNAANLQQERVELDQNRRSFGRFLLSITSFTVALGVLVSIASLAGLRRYERQSELEKQERQLAEFELRSLSHQLLNAQEEERKNISRELHDEVGQLLTGLRIELGNLQRSAAGGAAFETRIQEAKDLAEQALRSIRNLAMLLRPSMLDDQGLEPALKWQAREFSRRFEIPVNVQIDGAMDKVPAEHGVCLYRVIQEVLTNCARHAKARHIQIAVRAAEASVAASVEDDGVGFKVQSKEQSLGIGLLGIAERIREMRGTLYISSEPLRGTRVDVQLPIIRA